jgi:hypothetical protein
MTIFLATSAVAFLSVVLLMRALFWSRPRPVRTVFFAILVLSLAVAANPLARLFIFQGAAEAARGRMLSEALRANCVGRPAGWLIATYGRPFRVVTIEHAQHWWYTPGPAYWLHEDYVAFDVESGRVTAAYIQVN